MAPTTRSQTRGHLSIVELLVKAGASVHANNDEAIRWASDSGHLSVVELLVKAGANVHANNNEALRWASSSGHLPVVEFLKSCNV
jgi:ankyrin repeat protein